jgi:hypothetical protein
MMIHRDTLFNRKLKPGTKTMLLAGMLASGIFVSALSAQSATQAPPAKPAPAASAPTPRFQPNRFAGRAGRYYALFWGIDALSVKAVESGELIRFTYHVLDPDKSKAINDKKIDAFLLAQDSHIRLSVPTMEKVGQLRQSPPPEAGKTYWMAFSNPGRRVRPGDRVDVVIGQFRADGLVVE